MAKRLTLTDKILIALCGHTHLTIRAIRLLVKSQNTTSLYKALSDLRIMGEVKETKKIDAPSKRVITYYSITAYGLHKLRKRGHLPNEAYKRTQYLTALYYGSMQTDALMRYLTIADAEYMLWLTGIDVPLNFIDTSKLSQEYTHAKIFEGCTFPCENRIDFNFVPAGKLKERVRDEEARGGQLVGLLTQGAEGIVVYNDAFGRRKESQWLFALDQKIVSSYYVSQRLFAPADREKKAVCLYPHLKDVLDAFNGARNKRTKDMPLGMGYDSYIIIPMTYEGALNLKMYLKDSAGEWAIKSVYEKTEGGFSDLFTYKEKDKYIYNGVYIDSIKIDKLKNVEERFKDKYSNYKIICLPWQEEYYKALVPEAEIETI